MEYSNLIGCGALVFCSTTQRYLFLLRNGSSYDGNWALVGGRLEPGETPVQGLVREITEEIGMDFSGFKIIPVEQFTSETGNFVYHTYVIPVPEEFVPKLNHEHRGYCWVKLEDHPRPLHPGVWRTFKFDSVVSKIKTLETLLSSQ